MNKKQLIAVCLIGILIAVFFGLQTTHTDYQNPDMSSIDLSIYGKYIGSDISNAPYPALGKIAYIANYKYHLIIFSLVIGITLITILNGNE